MGRCRLRILYHNKRLQGTTTPDSHSRRRGQLYHNKRLQGTTTPRTLYHGQARLYHNKRLQGTTTTQAIPRRKASLYHNKRLQGTTTRRHRSPSVMKLYHNKRLQGILMFLNVTTVLKMLGVSPSSGYELMHEQNFLVLKVGSRMVVPEKRFLNGCHGIPKEVRIEVHTEER